MTSPTFTDEQLQTGLDNYNPEERLFQKIAGKTEVDLTEMELLAILRWKLGRVKKTDAELVKNFHEINKAIRLAAKKDKEIESIRRLCGVKGIKLSVASAILTVCFPDKFTIIDVRVLETLNLKPPDSAKWTPESYWNTFVPAVKQHCREGFDLRKVDMALWGLSVHKNIKKVMEL